MLTVELPLPNKKLNPNSRVHFMELAKAKKSAKRDAYLAGTSAINKSPEQFPYDCVWAQSTFFFRDNRQRDIDNHIACLKPYFDGMAEAGLVTNDSFIIPAPCAFHIDKENPRLILEFYRLKVAFDEGEDLAEIPSADEWVRRLTTKMTEGSATGTDLQAMDDRVSEEGKQIRARSLKNLGLRNAPDGFPV